MRSIAQLHTKLVSTAHGLEQPGLPLDQLHELHLDHPRLVQLARPIRRLECGPLHQLTWGTTGFEDPKSWCNTALGALQGFSVIPAPPLPPKDGSKNFKGCERVETTACVDVTALSPLTRAYYTCKFANTGVSSYRGFALTNIDFAGQTCPKG